MSLHDSLSNRLQTSASWWRQGKPTAVQCDVVGHSCADQYVFHFEIEAIYYKNRLCLSSALPKYVVYIPNWNTVATLSVSAQPHDLFLLLLIELKQ